MDVISESVSFYNDVYIVLINGKGCCSNTCHIRTNFTSNCLWIKTHDQALFLLTSTIICRAPLLTLTSGVITPGIAAICSLMSSDARLISSRLGPVSSMVKGLPPLGGPPLLSFLEQLFRHLVHLPFFYECLRPAQNLYVLVLFSQ